MAKAVSSSGIGPAARITLVSHGELYCRPIDEGSSPVLEASSWRDHDREALVEWYGPDDSWPRHGRDYFRASLKYARAAGWWLGKFEAHAFGKVVCDRDLSADSRCEFLIFSTGSGSESAALELRSIVDRCPHHSSSRHSQTATELAEDLLRQADLLIEAARRCVNADDLRSRAEELLGLAADAARDASDALASGVPEAELDRAVELEDAALVERHAAAQLADVACYPSDALVDPDPLLGAAENRVASAERRLGRPSDSGRKRSDLRRRVVATRVTIQSVREQLGISAR